MTAEQIRSIVQHSAFPGASEPVTLVETHISWVILTPDFAFKIKKPVAFGFLDYSTLEQRHFFCREEVRLNRRLSPDLYLGVLPIGFASGHPFIGTDAGPVLDYAVHMRRLETRLEMDVMLAARQVTPAHLRQLAAVLAVFHKSAIMSGPVVYHPGSWWADFAELYRLGPEIEQELGLEAIGRMQQWRTHIPAFLEEHAGRLIERVRAGFWVDGHGDLHARNIFLMPAGPVVFDGIEFSAHFRQSDVLNEIAFMCMDLDARGRPDLANDFLHAYLGHWNIMPTPEDRLLFTFFKAYRANVRLKVALLEMRQHRSAALDNQVKQYWQLLKRYLGRFG